MIKHIPGCIALSAIYLLAGYSMLYSDPAFTYSEYREVITQDDWPEPEQGEQILAMPQIRAILDRFNEEEGFLLDIRYPGGDSGRVWAKKLAMWLVALGIPDQYMELVPGSGGGDRLVLLLVDKRQ